MRLASVGLAFCILVVALTASTGRAQTQNPSVLYFEGEPRYEPKFLKRVFAGTNVRIATLMRITPGRLSRSGIEDETELAGGFPTGIEGLAKYDALILGPQTSEELSVEQERAIVNYVKQGGGLLLLGGHSSSLESDWKDSALGPVLPVDLSAPNEAQTDLEQPFGMARVERGPGNLHHPALVDAEGEVWLPTFETPAVWVGAPVAGARLEADVLLEGQREDGESTVLLAVWEHGSGRVGVLTASDTWRWQMKLPPEDHTHETFWRALVGWLADSESVSMVPVEAPP